MLPRVTIQPDVAGRPLARHAGSRPSTASELKTKKPVRPSFAGGARTFASGVATSATANVAPTRKSLDGLKSIESGLQLALHSSLYDSTAAGTGEHATGSPPASGSVPSSASSTSLASEGASELAALLGAEVSCGAAAGGHILFGSIPVPIVTVPASQQQAAEDAQEEAQPTAPAVAAACADGSEQQNDAGACQQQQQQLSAASAEFYPPAYLAAAAAATAIAAQASSSAAQQQLEHADDAPGAQQQQQLQQQQQDAAAPDAAQQQGAWEQQQQQQAYAAEQQAYYAQPQPHEQHAYWQQQAAPHPIMQHAMAAWQQQQQWPQHMQPVPMFFPVPFFLPYAAYPMQQQQQQQQPGEHEQQHAAAVPASSPAGPRHSEAGSAASAAPDTPVGAWQPPPEAAAAASYGGYHHAAASSWGSSSMAPSRPGSSASSVVSGYTARSSRTGAPRDAGTVTVSPLSSVKDAAGALAKVASRHGSCLLLSLARAGDQVASVTHVAAKSLAVARFYVNAHMAAGGAAGVDAAAQLTGLAPAAGAAGSSASASASGASLGHQARVDDELVFMPYFSVDSGASSCSSSSSASSPGAGDGCDGPLGFIVAKASARDLPANLPAPVGVPACMMQAGSGREQQQQAQQRAPAARAPVPLLKVGGGTDGNKLANAIINNVLSGDHVAIQLAGAAACQVAMRALVKARARLLRKFCQDIVATASFANEDTRSSIGRATVFLRLDVMASNVLQQLGGGGGGGGRWPAQQQQQQQLALGGC